MTSAHRVPSRALGVPLVVGCVCLAAVGCAEAPREADRGARVPPDGARLYAQACAKCHGEDGSGGLPMATNGPRPIDFRDPEWQRSRTDLEISAAIRDGRGAMPPFGDVITPEQIVALSQYVRDFGARLR